MPYQIAPEETSNWNLIDTDTRALVETDNHKFHIPPFQIEGSFSSPFVAIGIQVTPSGSNWRFGGYLSQEFGFDAPTYLQSNKAFYKTADLEINNVSIIQLPILTDEPYKLRFFPPTWFRSLKYEIWEYTGSVIETGAGGSIPTGQIEALARLINSQFTGLNIRLDTRWIKDDLYQANIRSRLNEIELKLNYLIANASPVSGGQNGNFTANNSESNFNINLGLI